MTFYESVIFRRAAEQSQPFVPGDAVTGFRLVQVGGQVFESQFFGLFGKSRAHSHKISSVFHIDHFFRSHFQRFDETFLQFRKEIQGTAQESHVAGNFPALGQVADCLVNYCLEN